MRNQLLGWWSPSFLTFKLLKIRFRKGDIQLLFVHPTVMLPGLPKQLFRGNLSIFIFFPFDRFHYMAAYTNTNKHALTVKGGPNIYLRQWISRNWKLNKSGAAKFRKCRISIRIHINCTNLNLDEPNFMLATGSKLYNSNLNHINTTPSI